MPPKRLVDIKDHALIMITRKKLKIA